PILDRSGDGLPEVAALRTPMEKEHAVAIMNHDLDQADRLFARHHLPFEHRSKVLHELRSDVAGRHWMAQLVRNGRDSRSRQSTRRNQAEMLEIRVDVEREAVRG